MVRWRWLGLLTGLGFAWASAAAAQTASPPAPPSSPPAAQTPPASQTPPPAPKRFRVKKSPSRSNAPPSKDEEAREQARAAYRLGQDLFEHGKFEPAEAAFAEAYRFEPNPVVLLAIAEARKGQGKITGAIQALERYLAERPDAPDRDEVQGRIADLKTTPAVLTVLTTPAGATVALDGKATPKTTPAQLELPPGQHAVTVGLEGYVDKSDTVELGPGDVQELHLTLDLTPPPPARVMGAGGGVPEPKTEVSAPEKQGKGELPPGVWISPGVAASALVTGTVLGFLALNQQSEFDAKPTSATADRGERFALFADVAFGVAAGAAVTGLVLYLTSRGKKEDSSDSDDTSKAQVAPMLVRRGGGVAARVGFR